MTVRIRESDALRLATACEFRYAVDCINEGKAEDAIRHVLRAASYLGAVPAIALYKENQPQESLDPSDQVEWDNLGVVVSHFMAAFCHPTAATPSNKAN
jgi:hypothetical protein